jgi:hypothetical protein
MLLSGCAIGFRGPALDVTYNSATLTGDVLSNRSENGYFFFNFGKTASYGQQAPPHPERVIFQAGVRQSVSADVADLEPATTYHYSLCAKDQEPGVSALCSADETFTTTGDYVRGTVGILSDIGFGFFTFNDVRSGPAGQSPVGSIDVFSTGGSTSGPVSCLRVTGDTRVTVGAAGFFWFFDLPVHGGPGTLVLESIGGQDPSVCPLDPTQGSTPAQATRSSSFSIRDVP